jgi:hypothetical protein
VKVEEHLFTCSCSHRDHDLVAVVPAPAPSLVLAPGPPPPPALHVLRRALGRARRGPGEVAGVTTRNESREAVKPKPKHGEVFLHCGHVLVRDGEWSVSCPGRAIGLAITIGIVALAAWDLGR